MAIIQNNWTEWQLNDQSGYVLLNKGYSESVLFFS